MSTGRVGSYARRATLSALAIVALAAAVTGVAYYRLTRAPLPQMTGALALRGLSGDVEVLRDRWGIPHVFARTERDAYLAQGYVTAQDRLWQMDMLRRSARGELSEVVGERAYQYDVGQRRLGLGLAADRALETMPAASRDALEAYAAGVNLYVEAHRDALPFEFLVLNYEPRPWAPGDTLAIGKLMAQTLGASWQQDLMRLRFRADLDPKLYSQLFVERSSYDVPFVGSDTAAPQTAPPAPTSVPAPPLPEPASGAAPTGMPDVDLFLALLEPSGDEAPRGSNNWVVGGARSASGLPLLANDPHLELGIPPIWHAVQLRVADGSLAVAGVTFPGAPGVIIGHNERVAWGVTNFNPDVQDLYAEEFDASGRRYRVGNGWVDAEVRREPILVRRDARGADVEERVAEVVVTRHGPVVSEFGTTKYALRWTALEPVNEVTPFYLLNRASDWDSFRAALRHYPGPMQSFVYADTAGNIGYFAAGNVPVRRTGTGDVPYSGAGDEGDWVGFIPFEELPSVFNPPSGAIVSANNRVVGSSESRFYTHEWISPFRARRIGELLAAQPRHTPATMSEVHADVYSYPHAIFAREALATAEARLGAGAAESEWIEIRELIEGWDGRLTAESVPASVVSAMRKHFNERLLRGRLGTRITRYRWFSRESLFARLVEERPAEWLPRDTATWDALFLESYRAAVRDLADRFGADRSGWRFGRLNAFTFQHPLGQVAGLGRILNSQELEMSGGAHTVKAFIGDQPRKWGSSVRVVFDLADFDRSTLTLTTGQSGHHASEHYLDQIDGWREVRGHAFPFTEAAVRGAAVDTLRLTPAP